MDLLDLLYADEPYFESGPVHSMMPCFRLACGRPWLHVRPRPRDVLGTLSGPHPQEMVTCPDCLTAYGDLAGLRAEIARQSGHQAKVSA